MDVTLIVARMLGDALGTDGKSCILVCLYPDSLLRLRVFASIDGVPRWTEHPVPSLLSPWSCHPQVVLKWILNH